MGTALPEFAGMLGNVGPEIISETEPRCDSAESLYQRRPRVLRRDLEAVLITVRFMLLLCRIQYR